MFDLEEFKLVLEDSSAFGVAPKLPRSSLPLCLPPSGTIDPPVGDDSVVAPAPAGDPPVIGISPRLPLPLPRSSPAPAPAGEASPTGEPPVCAPVTSAFSPCLPFPLPLSNGDAPGEPAGLAAPVTFAAPAALALAEGLAPPGETPAPACPATPALIAPCLASSVFIFCCI